MCIRDRAKLYSQAGRQERCVEICDDLILWFAEGKYVTKAMELKMQYEPLTPSQQQKYNSSVQGRRGTGVPHPALQPMPAYVPRTSGVDGRKRPRESTEELLQKMDSAGAAITQEASSAREQIEQNAREDKIDYVPVNSPEFLGRTVDLKEQLAKSIQEVFAGMKSAPEVPRGETMTVSAGDTGEILIQDLEPEQVEAEARLDTDGQKTVLTKAESKTAPVEEMPPQETNPALAGFDLDALLKETASNLSEELSSGTFGQTKESGRSGEEEQKNVVPPEKEAQESAVSGDTIDFEAMIEAATSSAIDTPKPREAGEPAGDTAVFSGFGETQTEEPAEKEREDKTKTFQTMRERAEDATREILTKNITSETRRFVAPGDTVPMSVEEVLREETPEERRLRILNEDRPEKFNDDQKKIFSYFAKVPGMDQQVLDALSGVYSHVTEKTSKHGNVAVMGGYGTGKTRLSEGIVRAVCKDLGLEAAKYAQIDAADLNKKDPAVVVSKMSGGFLLIQRAGLLYPDVIKKLNKALEFRTDSMIVIIEDEKTSMRGLLRNNPEFASKFDTVISIPVFTNDELVTFARTYARENGYKMDEMGVLALYTLIGDNQTENEPMTITKVKDIVDKAIKRAGKGTRRFGRKVSGKRTDDQDRIILYEKDFDF